MVMVKFFWVETIILDTGKIYAICNFVDMMRKYTSFRVVYA